LASLALSRLLGFIRIIGNQVHVIIANDFHSFHVAIDGHSTTVRNYISIQGYDRGNADYLWGALALALASKQLHVLNRSEKRFLSQFKNQTSGPNACQPWKPSQVVPDYF
jgi:hypothetical protein